MSGLKRKAQELGEQGLSAAVGEVAARTVSAAVGRYEALATVDDQLDDLKRLVVMVHSAADAAGGVHIRSWWLRQWLSRLRDAAADGDEVLRLFRQRQRAAEEEEAINAQQSVWGRVLRRAKGLLLCVIAGDEEIERLNRTVARLEKVATGIGDFLQLIELEIRVSIPLRPMRPLRQLSTLRRSSVQLHRQYDLFGISHEQYAAMRKRILLLIVRRNIQGAIDRFRATPAHPATGPPCFQPQDDVQHLVSDIRDALVASDKPEVQGRRWLAEWRRGLQDVVERANQGCGDDDLRTILRSVEKAAAHLEDFVRLLRIYRVTI